MAGSACHPERKHHARGKCTRCYQASRVASPEARERKRKADRERAQAKRDRIKFAFLRWAQP